VRTAALNFERNIPLEGCYNFRDLGGYRTSDGRWTRPQQLYRADGPHALTAGDVRILEHMSIATVIDLRTPTEVEQRGCYTAAIANVVEYHLPMVDVLPDTEELPGWVDPTVVARRYREMLDAGGETMAEVLTILSDPNAYPAVFHCSAGKDRTGILTAVILGLLHVPDDTIIADYALSAASMARLVDYYKREYPDAIEQLERIAPAMVAAHPDTMTVFIDGVRRDYGGFAGYAESIGVGHAPRRLREALLT
jgi:protein-tyrosine phosphatase